MRSMLKQGKAAARAVLARLPVLDRVVLTSTGYRVLTRAQAEKLSARPSGWLSGRSARSQEKVYDWLLSRMHEGHPRADFLAAADAIRQTRLTNPALLEIGCGSGYYSEILPALLHAPIDYTGVDFSPAMVERAKARYPRQRFQIADATALPFPDASFDVAFNGVSLMHIMHYRTAIREAARVAGRFMILHGVPVMDDHDTIYLRKYAYGRRVVEIIFSEPELLSLIADAGFAVEATLTSAPYDVGRITGVPSRAMTYLCRRAR